MASKTANILARVEPEVKAQAEAIMDRLGIPASVVINMLYRQIIMTGGIPFPLTVPSAPRARDELSAAEFDSMLSRGLEAAKAGSSVPAAAAFAELRREVQHDG